MSVGEAPPGLVGDGVIGALRRVVKAGQVAQVMLRLQMAMDGAPARWGKGADSAPVRLARRAAASVIEARDGEAVRVVFRAALVAAVEGQDADLRARLLLAIATRYHEIGHDRDCLALLRLVEADERVSDLVRAELAAAKASADKDSGSECELEEEQ